MSARHVVTHALNMYYADSRDTKAVVTNLLAMLRSEMNAELIGEVTGLRAQVAELEAERHTTNEALSAAVEELHAEQARMSMVADFCAQRAEYVDNLRDHASAEDYYRWTGHAEARRQLSNLLGIPVAWPASAEECRPARQQEDPHDGPLHHDYAVSHDLPPYTPNVRGDR